MNSFKFYIQRKTILIKSFIGCLIFFFSIPAVIILLSFYYGFRVNLPVLNSFGLLVLRLWFYPPRLILGKLLSELRIELEPTWPIGYLLTIVFYIAISFVLSLLLDKIIVAFNGYKQTH